MTPEQIANIVTQVIQNTNQTQPTTSSQQADDFIPATHVYDHEKPQSISEMATSSFTPVAEEPVIQTPQSTPSAPPFAITPMEQDLVVMLKHLLDVEKQDLATVENVFIQQTLRVLQRIEVKVDSLEEMITDELLGASKDDDLPEPQLLFQSNPTEEGWVKDKFDGKKETEQEKTHDQETWPKSKTNISRQEAVITHVSRSGGKPPRAKGNAGKRRRRKRNRKNKR